MQKILTGDLSGMNEKDRYRILCEQDLTIPLFNRSWWLDLVCGEDGWNVATYSRDGKIFAALPYITKWKYGRKIITQPKFTQTLGVWYAPSEAKYAKRLGQEKDIIFHLVSSLPDHDIFFQSFHYSFTNWLPFYLLGFEQTTKYTYVIDNLGDIDEIWKETNANIKTDIRKASKILEVINDISYEEFYEVIRKTYTRQKMKIPFSFLEFSRIAQETKLQNSGMTFAAIDNDKNVHAVLFLVWDNNSSYYLLGGRNPEFKNVGAASLCLWEAIKFSSKITKSFNFEGSMVENIERFFRAFGARQKSYFRITKFNSVFVSLLYHYRRFKNGKL